MAKTSMAALAFASATFASAEKDPSSNRCGVYLAQSSTGRGLGSYAGRDYRPDDVIGSSDAVVQSVYSRENSAHLEGETNLGTCWSGDATGGNGEGDVVVSTAGGPCFGSTIHMGMINAAVHHPSTLLRTDSELLKSGYDEATSPGRGAFTTYHNLTLLAVDKIPAGAELFLDDGMKSNRYGDASKPNIDDYRKMDKAIERMVGYFNKHAEYIGEDAANEVFEFMKKDILDLAAENRAGAARSLLPDSYLGLQEIIDRGGSALFSNPEVVKDLGWLEENGYCQDNLVVGVSTIEHAGRGAFARRSLKEGEVITPMPLAAIPQGRSSLSIDKEVGGINRYQLLYNYVLEHPESSAMFFPGGALSSYINHGGNKANAKMLWSTKDWSNIKGAQEISVANLTEVHPIDMILEVVATRPIEEGEEVLLDYGNAWDEAWKEHSSKWEEVTKDENFAESAMVLNEVHHGAGKPPRPFPTKKEEEGKEYDDENKIAVLKCHILYDEDKIERRRNQDGTRTKVYPWIPHPAAGESRLKTDSAIRGANRVGCKILKRFWDEQTGYKYVVQPDSKGESILVKNVPHHAIRYADKPYKSAQHERTAFRHTIQFPDEVFPKAWKDLDVGGSVEDDL